MEVFMKRLLLVLLVLSLAMAVFAGGGQQGASGAKAAADYGARTTGPNYWMVKFDQPVTLHVVNIERPNTPFLPGDDVTRNEWTRAFKEKLNVEIVTDWVASTTGYNEKVNLAIASKQIPDVMRVIPLLSGSS